METGFRERSVEVPCDLGSILQKEHIRFVQGPGASALLPFLEGRGDYPEIVVEIPRYRASEGRDYEGAKQGGNIFEDRYLIDAGSQFLLALAQLLRPLRGLSRR